MAVCPIANPIWSNVVRSNSQTSGLSAPKPWQSRCPRWISWASIGMWTCCRSWARQADSNQVLKWPSQSLSPTCCLEGPAKMPKWALPLINRQNHPKKQLNAPLKAGVLLGVRAAHRNTLQFHTFRARFLDLTNACPSGCCLRAFET